MGTRRQNFVVTFLCSVPTLIQANGSRELITAQIVQFHTLNTPGFEHFLRSNNPN